jgi:hypothetical protein
MGRGIGKGTDGRQRGVCERMDPRVVGDAVRRRLYAWRDTQRNAPMAEGVSVKICGEGAATIVMAPRHREPTLVTHVHACADVLELAAQTSIRTLVLADADGLFPGGRVAAGMAGPEETLFRRTNLWLALGGMRHYPLRAAEAIAVPSVVVIKESEAANFEPVTLDDADTVDVLVMPRGFRDAALALRYAYAQGADRVLVAAVACDTLGRFERALDGCPRAFREVVVVAPWASCDGAPGLSTYSSFL